jgi:hypothetical protein
LTQTRQADILLYIFKNWEFAQGHTQTDHALIADENQQDRFSADFMFQPTAEEKAEVVATCDLLMRLKFAGHAAQKKRRSRNSVVSF